MNNPKCFRCGEYGHVSAFCTQATDICYNCKSPGHLSRDCPEPHPPVRCYNCGAEGHMSSECDQPKQMTCHLCGQPGHIARECPSAATARIDGPGPVSPPAKAPGAGAGGANSLVPDVGVIGSGLQNGASAGVGAGGPGQFTEQGQGRGCYFCGKPGHFQRECPQNPAASPGRTFTGACNRCGAPGHMARNCPAPLPLRQGPGGSGVPRGPGGPVPNLGRGSVGGAFNMASLAAALPGMNGGGGPASVRCYVCQGMGHMSRECPSKAALGIEGPGVRCYLCGAFGHMQRNCPQAAGEGGVVAMKCYLCGGVGHMQRNCPQAAATQKCFQCGQTGHLSRDCPSLECYTCHGKHFARECPVARAQQQEG